MAVGSMSIYHLQRGGFLSIKRWCWNRNNDFFFQCLHRYLHCLHHRDRWRQCRYRALFPARSLMPTYNTEVLLAVSIVVFTFDMNHLCGQLVCCVTSYLLQRVICMPLQVLMRTNGFAEWEGNSFASTVSRSQHQTHTLCQSKSMNPYRRAQQVNLGTNVAVYFIEKHLSAHVYLWTCSPTLYRFQQAKKESQGCN